MDASHIGIEDVFVVTRKDGFLLHVFYKMVAHLKVSGDYYSSTLSFRLEKPSIISPPFFFSYGFPPAK